MIRVSCVLKIRKTQRKAQVGLVVKGHVGGGTKMNGDG